MIEQELRELRVWFPPEPDLERRVLGRVERRRRRWLVPVLLAAVAAVGALFAIPQTRAAILDFFRIGGVEVERVDTQPVAPVVEPDLGRRITLDDARAAAGFDLVVPDAEFETYYEPPIVSMKWSRFVLSQWRGEQLPFVQKQVGPASQTVSVSIDGATGLWITGARHEVIWRVPGTTHLQVRERRLVGNVLIWERGTVTYRLEGARSLDEALETARNLSAP